MLKKLVRQEPAFTPGHLTLGEALLAAGNDEGALEAWREGYVRSDCFEFLVRISSHYLSRHNPAGAIATFRELAARSGGGQMPRFFLAQLFSRLEMVDEAWKQIMELRDEIAESPTLDYYLARTHERRAELGEACDLYRKVIKDTGGLDLIYHCNGCDATIRGYQSFCSNCRTWDTFKVIWTEPETPTEWDEEAGSPAWLGGTAFLEPA
jgi:lipopolysaccharide biosynthesis regulator YciM